MGSGMAKRVQSNGGILIISEAASVSLPMDRAGERCEDMLTVCGVRPGGVLS
jgi:hypothetical protein